MRHVMAPLTLTGPMTYPAEDSPGVDTAAGMVITGCFAWCSVKLNVTCIEGLGTLHRAWHLCAVRAREDR